MKYEPFILFCLITVVYASFGGDYFGFRFFTTVLGLNIKAH